MFRPTFPFFLVWLLVPYRTGAEPQLDTDPSVYPQLTQLRAEKRDARKHYDEVRNSDVGIRWSNHLGRFEERSIRGRELNDQLEYWEREKQRIKGEIDEMMAPEESAASLWRKSLLARSKTQSQNAAKMAGLKWAIFAFLAVWFGAELVGQLYPDFISYFESAWNPNPSLLHPGLALGATVGWAAGCYQYLNPSPAFAEDAQAKFEEYQSARRDRQRAEDEAFEKARPQSSSDDAEDDDVYDDGIESEEQDTIETWYEALGVSSEATKDEIKTAYRKKIKQYHPDLVSGLGEKLRALAELETQKLNAAKEEGLSLRL